jgi:hypothetical protein
LNAKHLPNVEPRLQSRYEKLVSEHLHSGEKIAAGQHALPTESAKAFAATQAAWRFYANDAVTLPVLAEPLKAYAVEALSASRAKYALIVHDWSHLKYSTHESKTDRKLLSNKRELGYMLQTALLVDSITGTPIAPLVQSVTFADGQHTTLSESVKPEETVLDALTTAMKAVEQSQLDAQVVHIVDREADSVWHYRHWDQEGLRFLVRADDQRVVRHNGVERKLPEVASFLRPEMKFSRIVEYKGRKAWQYVAESTVILERPAVTHRVTDGVRERQRIPGRPLTLRLVVSEVRDESGQVLSLWLLLTNVAGVPASEIALWYYWRWSIETYFKLLKSAGHQVEQWQQESAAAIAKRLLITAMACVIVWQVARSKEPEAAEFRQVLVGLSGRQMKHKRQFTEPAMLVGLNILLAMLNLLEHYDLQYIKELASSCLPGVFPLRSR